MKTVGIITEYNPFHNGHQYQIQFAKEILGADYTVIAMSGDFVQRGTPALLPKHIRAEMALHGGADLVLELPVSVSTASAEFFAAGGVNLLDQLGVVDTLCFGCENNFLNLFQKTAQILVEEPEIYRVELQKGLKSGKSFPVARSQALISYFKELSYMESTINKSKPEMLLSQESDSDFSEDFLNKFFNSPNNILGIEYCKALIRQNSAMIPHPLKREGADYHELTLTDHTHPSASGIRHLLAAGFSYASSAHPTLLSDTQLDDIKKALNTMIPELSLNTFLNVLSQNGCIFEHHLDLLLHFRLLEESFESLTKYLDVNEELARRIINSRNKYQNFIQFTELLKTKELTFTRIQRALLHIILKIQQPTMCIPYARVLGFRKSAGPLLKKIKENGRIPIITKLADADQSLNEEGQRILMENTFASNLYESLIQQQTHGTFRHEYIKPVVIL